MAHFQGSFGLERGQIAQNGLKMGSFRLFVHPKWFKNIFWEKFFYPFLVPKQPIFKAFWDFQRAKTGHHRLKTRQRHLV